MMQTNMEIKLIEAAKELSGKSSLRWAGVSLLILGYAILDWSSRYFIECLNFSFLLPLQL